MPRSAQRYTKNYEIFGIITNRGEEERRGEEVSRFLFRGFHSMLCFAIYIYEHIYFIYTHIYTHIHIHTYIHTHIPTFPHSHIRTHFDTHVPKCTDIHEKPDIPQPKTRRRTEVGRGVLAFYFVSFISGRAYKHICIHFDTHAPKCPETHEKL